MIEWLMCHSKRMSGNSWNCSSLLWSQSLQLNAFGSRSNYGRFQTPHLSEALPLSHYLSLLVEAPGWEKGTARHQKKCPCSKEPHHGNSCHNQSLPIWSNLKHEQKSEMFLLMSWQSSHAAQKPRERWGKQRSWDPSPEPVKTLPKKCWRFLETSGTRSSQKVYFSIFGASWGNVTAAGASTLVSN